MSIVESAQDVWLAGLGAVSKAQEEGQDLFKNFVREGNELFSKLVAEGGRVQKRGRKTVESSADEVQSVIESRISELRGRATDTWDQVEKMFQDRVTRAMSQLGVPTAEDMERLQRRVDALNESVRDLAETQGAGGRKKKATRKKATTGRKTTRKKTASKKTASKKKTGKKKASKKKTTSSS